MPVACETGCCPGRDQIELVAVLHALSDHVRLDMVQELAVRTEVGCGDFALQVSKSTGSHHFKVLREAGVVLHREAGTRRFYRLRRSDLDARFPGLLDSVLLAGAGATKGAAR
jgi:DNA-binding transcriptional ArsR family regulator